MKILQKNNKKLRMISKEVESIDKEIILFAKDLNRTMIINKGVGIASPQVGKLIRLIIVKIDNKNVTMINPVITKYSEETALKDEGCLSVMGVTKKVNRSKYVNVTYTDIEGDKISMILNELSSRIVQHEIDHLNGVLFIDKALK